MMANESMLLHRTVKFYDCGKCDPINQLSGDSGHEVIEFVQRSAA